MKYWVTTHWPPRIDEKPDLVHEGVYVPDGRQEAVADMHSGDYLWIYETRSGRPEKRRLVDGREEMVPCHEGREGVVVLAKIGSEIYEIEESEPTDYYGGSRVWWRYGADTETLNSHGFVPREELNRILGYSEDFNLHGFGDSHSGVKEIDKPQFDQIMVQFLKSNEAEIGNLKKNIQKKPHRSGAEPTGEGETHRQLKEKIAHDPAAVLGEDGLKLVKTEYEFITKDRVDVLLEDRFGRLVVVEVEPECLSGELIGPAQCLKYQALVAFETERQLTEIRSMLVATSISEDIVDVAKRHLIEPKEVGL